MQLQSSGYDFHIDTNDPNHGNLVCANNQITGTGMGVTNIPLTGRPTTLLQAIGVGSGTGLSQTSTFTTAQAIWLPLINTAPCD